MPLVFVYGTLKKGHRNHYVIEGPTTTFHSTAVLPFKARMFCVGFPVIVKSASPIQIEGELYSVDRATFRDLDSLESNGRMYKRRRKRLADGRLAWVYIGMDRFWQARTHSNPVLPDADGVTRWRAR